MIPFNIDLGMVPAKIAWTSMDLTGPVSEASNLLGPGVHTPCGSLPEAYTTMQNATNFDKVYTYFRLSLNPDPANIGYHDTFAYLWPADAAALANSSSMTASVASLATWF